MVSPQHNSMSSISVPVETKYEHLGKIYFNKTECQCLSCNLVNEPGLTLEVK